MVQSQSQDNFRPDKWARAVINLETRQGYFNTPDYHEIIRKWQKQEITNGEFWVISQQLNEENPRRTGSCVFLKYKDRYFLITARHVLEDLSPQFTPPGYPITEKRIQLFEKLLIVDNGSSFKDNSIPGLKKLISHYTTGGRKPYIFAPNGLDLAILNLDNRDVGWDKPETLQKMGFIPIDISDVDTLCEVHKDQLIYSIGYTGEIAPIGKKRLTKDQLITESDIVSLPVISQGAIGDDYSDSNYFGGKILAYHGNSGGAIVSNDKLIGIVSGGLRKPELLDASNLPTYLTLELKVIKLTQLISLLDQLSEQSPTL